MRYDDQDGWRSEEAALTEQIIKWAAKVLLLAIIVSVTIGLISGWMLGRL